MVESLEDAALIVKSSENAIRIHAALNQLDGENFARVEAAGEIHDAHAAFANAAQQLVGAERSAEVQVRRRCAFGMLV